VTAFLSRKSRNVPVLIAKLMFSGMLPVMFATLSASSFSATTPTTLPLVSSNGPPLGCLGIEAEAEKLSGEVATPEDLAAAPGSVSGSSLGARRGRRRLGVCQRRLPRRLEGPRRPGGHAPSAALMCHSGAELRRMLAAATRVCCRWPLVHDSS
jgi:hypothetical protein